MAKVKCPNCGRAISDQEDLTFVGTATVRGTATLRVFHDRGIEWDVSDSENEEVICPGCKEPFSPNWVDLRKQWKV